MQRTEISPRVPTLSAFLAFFLLLAAGPALAETPPAIGAPELVESPDVEVTPASPVPCLAIGCCTSPAPAGTSCREDSDCGSYCATNSTKAGFPCISSADCNGAACQNTFCEPCPTDTDDGTGLCEDVPVGVTTLPIWYSPQP